MNGADRYGTLTAPEQQAHIEVVEDPSRTARSSYQLWREQIARMPDARECSVHPCNRYRDRTCRNLKEDLLERLYRQACDIIKPRRKALRQLGPSQLEELLKELPRTRPATGLFASALLNYMDARVLDGVFQQHIFGYRLAAGKTLIAREGTRVCNLGTKTRGTLVNYGSITTDFARSTQGGVQVNFGYVPNFALFSPAGIQVNLGTVGENFYGDGIQVNFGSVNNMATGAEGGVQVNFRSHQGMFAFYTHSGVQVDANQIAVNGRRYILVNRGGEGRGERPKLTPLSFTSGAPQIRTLLDRLRSLSWLEELREHPERAAQTIREYDWQSFEQDILRKGKAVERMVRK